METEQQNVRITDNEPLGRAHKAINEWFDQAEGKVSYDARQAIAQAVVTLLWVGFHLERGDTKDAADEAKGFDQDTRRFRTAVRTVAWMKRGCENEDHKANGHQNANGTCYHGSHGTVAWMGAHWHVHRGLPGYLPDASYGPFESFGEGLDALVSERVADEAEEWQGGDNTAVERGEDYASYEAANGQVVALEPCHEPECLEEADAWAPQTKPSFGRSGTIGLRSSRNRVRPPLTHTTPARALPSWCAWAGKWSGRTTCRWTCGASDRVTERLNA